MIFSRRAGDAHEHVEEVGVIELVADEGDRASLTVWTVRRMRHHGPASLLALDVMLARQLVERFDDGDPADTVVLGQLAFSGQEAPGWKLAALDPLQQGRVDLVVERQRVARVDGPDSGLAHRAR